MHFSGWCLQEIGTDGPFQVRIASVCWVVTEVQTSCWGQDRDQNRNKTMLSRKTWVFFTFTWFVRWEIIKVHSPSKISTRIAERASVSFPDWYHILEGKVHLINSPPLSAAYMHQWIRSALFQMMACCPFSTKPLHKPMLSYCQLDL